MHSFDKIHAVLWDVDGTLFSAQDILADTYRQAFCSFQKNTDSVISVPSLDAILEQIGRPVQEIFQNLAPNLNLAERERLSLQVLSSLVKVISFGGGKYYEKMQETLAKLYNRGYQFFSASNGRYPYIEAILRSSNTLQYFQEVKTIDNKTIKNKTELVRDTLERHKLQPEKAVLVGDRSTDRDAAYANGVAFIAASYGHGKAAEWQNAALVIHSLQELELHLLDRVAN